MSWSHPPHASVSEHNPSVGPTETEANMQVYTDLVNSLQLLAAMESQQSQQSQHQTPSIALPLHYQQSSFYPLSSQPFSLSPPHYTTSPLPQLPELSRRRHRRPVPMVYWTAFVDSLEWLVNAEIPREDRTCPFCWGEFALEVEDVEEEEEDDSDSDSDEEDDVSEYEDGGLTAESYAASQWANEVGHHALDEIWAQALMAPTLNTPATDPGTSMAFSDSMANSDNGNGYETDHEEDSLSGVAASDLEDRVVGGAQEEISLGPEPTRLGKRHYAVKLPCGHLFGHMCLVTMLKSGERVCPKCRKDIT